MASSIPPVKGAAFTFDMPLVSQADTDIFKTSPTLAAGDITVSIDGGNFANITTLPTQIQTTGVLPVALTAAEMNGDRITVLFHDAAGSEWQDALVTIYTAAQTLDTTDAAVDAVKTDTAAILLDTGTDGVVLANDAITSAKFDESTAYPLKSADTGATQVARTGADSDTLETLSDQLDAQEPADVWAYATRTLTSTAASTTAAVSGSTLTITAATTYSATLTGLTIPADWLDMWFTVKDDDSKADSASVVQIHKSNPADAANDGLVYLNGAAGTKADGSLTVDQAAGTVAIRIEATATDDLTRQSGAGYDVKVQSTAAGVTLLTEGTCNIQMTETKTID